MNKYSIMSMKFFFFLIKETPTNLNTRIDTEALLYVRTHTHTHHTVVMLCGTSGPDYAEVSPRFIL